MRLRKLLFFVACCLLLIPSCATAQQTNAALKSTLNSKGYILASPAESWPYPGGFLLANKKSTTFIDLPGDVERPTTEPSHADFMAEQHRGRTGISVILTGLVSLIGGNPGVTFTNTNNVTFKELSADGTRIKYQQAAMILDSPRVKDQVNEWMKSGLQVYIIANVLTTKKISIASDSNTAIGISFNGSSASKCDEVSASSSEASSNNKAKSKDPGTSGSDKNGKSTESAPPSDTTDAKKDSGASDKNTPASNAPSKPSADTTAGGKKDSSGNTADKGSTSPGGELHFCHGVANTVTMNTDQPLVFAAAAFQVDRDKSGKLSLRPLFVPTKNGSFEVDNTLPQQELITIKNTAKKLNGAWGQQRWPEK
jgi:hypothetical protein